MTIDIRPLTPGFAGEVFNANLTRPLAPTEVAALEPEERERAGVMEDVDREMVGQVFK